MTSLIRTVMPGLFLVSLSQQEAKGMESDRKNQVKKRRMQKVIKRNRERLLE
jgi:hypothetical protein